MVPTGFINKALKTEHQFFNYQFNCRVGDILGNAEKMIRRIKRHSKAKVPTIILFPEMALTGYPLQDLVRVHGFTDHAMQVLEATVAPLAVGNVAIIVGTSWRVGNKIYNAAVFCYEGKIQHVFKKTELPNDSVFDEVRTYKPGKPTVATWKGLTFGSPICEDVWHKRVAKTMKRLGAQILLSPNASPYDKNKWPRREKVLKDRIAQTGLPLVYLNRWGGQDELVFDGQSALLLPNGEVHRAAMYKDACISFSFDGTTVSEIEIDNPFVQMDEQEECWQHHLVAIRDYVGRHGKGSAVLALSGGIDSALVACLVSEALGPDKLKTYGLPSGFSSEGSKSDAGDLANALGVSFKLAAIEDTVNTLRVMNYYVDKDYPSGVMDENLQARTRGVFIMGRSNKGEGMVVTTGNKSEMSVGYSTLYGDMNGGFNPIKDLYKTEVFALALWRAEKYRAEGNPAAAEVLERTVNKPPSAELRENQQDSDSLPPYPVLDAILTEVIENLKVPHEISIPGVEYKTVERVYYLVKNAEFKRRQSCPGTRWHKQDLDKDWRMPLDNGYNPSSIADAIADMVEAA